MIECDSIITDNGMAFMEKGIDPWTELWGTAEWIGANKQKNDYIKRHTVCHQSNRLNTVSVNS